MFPMMPRICDHWDCLTRARAFYCMLLKYSGRDSLCKKDTINIREEMKAKDNTNFFIKNRIHETILKIKVLQFC
jgi:hypothetical protein